MNEETKVDREEINKFKKIVDRRLLRKRHTWNLSPKHVIIEKDELEKLTKARTPGAKDLFPRKRRYKVTLADGRKLLVEAVHTAEAVRLARDKFKFAVQRVEEQK
jgi:hypothetical protein